MVSRAAVGVGISLTLLAACSGTSGKARTSDVLDATPLHDAFHDVTSVIVYDIFSPPQASRVYAYASVAAYEVLRQTDSSYRSLAGQLNGLTPVPAREANAEYSLPLAGVHAMMSVATQLTFSRARMDTLRRAADEQYRKSGLSSAVYERSIAYGDTVAKHVLAWASKDNYKEMRGMPKYTVTKEVGRWVPTPPAYMDAVEPNWGKLRPFLLDSASEYRPEPPYPFDPKKGSLFYAQMQEVHDVGVGLTEEQRNIAAFWDCNPYVMHVQGHTMFATKKITPGGHWMGIVGIASRQAHANILVAADAYARTALALADGFLSVWESKYVTNVIRPETVINTYLDDKWEPLLQTPPFPEYTSGHSVISTSAATVLSEQFGESVAFADSTEHEYGLPVRSFTSFKQAAEEAAISRLYGGIHYRRAITEGQAQGAKVGAHVVQRLLTHPSTRVAGR
jgi:membrane-associated phospholipid phosphatase